MTGDPSRVRVPVSNDPNDFSSGDPSRLTKRLGDEDAEDCPVTVLFAGLGRLANVRLRVGVDDRWIGRVGALILPMGGFRGSGSRVVNTRMHSGHTTHPS